MDSSSKDSATETEYTVYSGDDTVPNTPNTPNTSPGLTDYLLAKLDSNVEEIKIDVKNIDTIANKVDDIKDNVREVNHKVSIDMRMIISDISIGIISSLIVSIIFLFATTNLKTNSAVIFGMELPLFIVFVLSIFLAIISTHFITKKFFFRNNIIKEDLN